MSQVKVNVRELGVDMLTIVGHKFGAPKGVAALYIREGVQIDNFFHGGSQVLLHHHVIKHDSSTLQAATACVAFMPTMAKTVYPGYVHYLFHGGRLLPIWSCLAKDTQRLP